MIPIQAPANTALYDLARIAQATGNMLVVERWQIVMRPTKGKRNEHQPEHKKS